MHGLMSACLGYSWADECMSLMCKAVRDGDVHIQGGVVSKFLPRWSLLVVAQFHYGLWGLHGLHRENLSCRVYTETTK